MLERSQRKNRKPEVTSLAAGPPAEAVELLVCQGKARIHDAMGSIRRITEVDGKKCIELIK